MKDEGKKGNKEGRRMGGRKIDKKKGRGGGRKDG